jgi:hypothetical protein
VDALLVGLLTALGAMLGMVAWHLLARPEAVFALWRDPAEPWPDEHEGTVAALRTAVLALVFLVGFLTGLALSFLTATSG